jgi:thiol-disulfide isomerase/thioredoxin
MERARGSGRTGAVVAILVGVVVLGGCGGTSSPVSSPSGSPVAPSLSAAGSTGASAAAAPARTSAAAAGRYSGPLLSLGHGSAGVVYDPSRNAAQDVVAALHLARSKHLRVLVDFGADWCPDCKVLDALYRAKDVAPALAANYVLVTVDVGKFDHNLELSDRYGGVIAKGVPALVVLDASGRVVTTTRDGSFENARSMTSSQVGAFLRRWSAVSG